MNAPSANAPNANPIANPNPNAEEAAKRLRLGETPENREKRARNKLGNSELKYKDNLIKEARTKCIVPGWVVDWDYVNKSVIYRNESGEVLNDCPSSKQETWVKNKNGKWERVLGNARGESRTPNVPKGTPREGRWFQRMSSKGKPFWVRVDGPNDSNQATSWIKPIKPAMLVDKHGTIIGGRRKQTRRVKRKGRKTRSRR